MNAKVSRPPLSAEQDALRAGAGDSPVVVAAKAPWPLDRTYLQDLALQVQAQYERAQPWPHAVVMGLLPDDLIAAAAREGLEVDSSTIFRTVGRNQVKEETSSGLGPASRQILDQLEAPSFLEFLAFVTGIPDLLADPTHKWAGLHRSSAGGFTMIHRDFWEHPVSGLHHRVNVLLYLNEEWPLEYGGALELWPSDMHAVGRVIRPLANTLVIFETHDQTLHGLPEPVACPTADARVSLASYYYTTAPRAQKVPVRRPVFARRPQDGFLIGRRRPVSVIGSLTPEPLQPAARALMAKIRAMRGHPKEPTRL